MSTIYDSSYNATRYFTMIFSDADNMTLVDDVATGTILDLDDEPAVSIHTSTTVNE